MAATEMRRTVVTESGDRGIILIQGIVATILGLLLISAPEASLFVLTALLGVYWLVAGVLSFVKLFTGTARHNWFWSIVIGVLGVFAGVIVLRHPLWSTQLVPTVLVLILGIDALIMGVVNGIRGFTEGSAFFAVGVLDLILGVVLLASPLFVATLLPVVLGVFALFGGISMIAFSFTMRPRVYEEVVAEEKRAA